MCNLPECIWVVIIKYSKDNESVLRMLKEYFDKMHHIGYGLQHNKDIYYVLPYTDTYHKILSDIDVAIFDSNWDIFGYVAYDYDDSNSCIPTTVYNKSLYKPFVNSRYFPQCIEIESKYIETLKSFLED